MIQAHMRVRHLRDNELHIFIDPTAGKYDPYMTREEMDAKQHVIMEQERNMRLRYGRDFVGTSDMWYELLLDALVERNHSVRRILDVFQYFLEQCNYTMTQAVADDYDAELEIENLGPVEEFEYKMVPELMYSDVVELRTREVNRAHGAKPLTELEKASLQKWTFDSTIPFILPEDRRSAVWAVYQKLGQTRWDNLRVELGLATRQITMKDDILKEERGDLWNSGFARRLETIEQIIKMFGFKNTLEQQPIGKQEFEAKIDPVEYSELEGFGQEAFEIRDRSKEKKVSAKRVRQFIDTCFEQWSGARLTSDKKKEKMVNGVRTRTSGYTLTPADLSLSSVVIPRGEKQKERTRVYEWRQEHDRQVEMRKVDREVRRRKWEISMGMPQKEEVVQDTQELL